MAFVFREAFRGFRRLCGEQASGEGASGSRVAAELSSAAGEDETEQMGGVSGEDRVGLSAGDFLSAGHFGNAAEIVAEIRVERSQVLVDRQGHWREKLDAVRFSFGTQPHNAIEESIGALLWREARDIGGAAGLGLSRG